MQMNDMVMISVDDHICEPPTLFDRHLSGEALATALGRPGEAGVKRPVTSGDVLQMFKSRNEKLAQMPLPASQGVKA